MSKEQEYVVDWNRNGEAERVICRGASAEERGKCWATSLSADQEVTDLAHGAREFDTEAAQKPIPAAVHVGGPTVTLRLGNEYQDLGKGEEYQSTFFDGANAEQRATEFAARAKERAY